MTTRRSKPRVATFGTREMTDILDALTQGVAVFDWRYNHLNPVPEKEWPYIQSIRMMQQLMGGRMYPLTLEGLDSAMRELAR